MISVIIPTYNREKTIMRAISSVLNQTYSDIECIVVDDGSTDDTRKIINAVSDPRLKYIYQENSGANAARNRGIHEARGEYIAFQDSDDEWMPLKLESQLRYLQEEDVDICICKGENVNYPTGAPKYRPILEGNQYYPYERICTNVEVGTQTIIAKRKVFEQNLFDEMLKKVQDYDWLVRAGKNNSIYFVDEILVKRYMQDDSISKQGLLVSISTHQYLVEKYRTMYGSEDYIVYCEYNRIGKLKEKAGENGTEYFLKALKLKFSIKQFIIMLLSATRMYRYVFDL